MEVDPKVPVKVNFDCADRYRTVPKGIFPHPDRKRTVMQNQSAQEPKASLASDMAQYEKDPYEFMIRQELKVAKSLKDITPEVSLITNLQNMKYSLLSDCSEQQIFNDFLLKLDVTD